MNINTKNNFKHKKENFIYYDVNNNYNKIINKISSFIKKINKPEFLTNAKKLLKQYGGVNPITDSDIDEIKRIYYSLSSNIIFRNNSDFKNIQHDIDNINNDNFNKICSELLSIIKKQLLITEKEEIKKDLKFYSYIFESKTSQNEEFKKINNLINTELNKENMDIIAIKQLLVNINNLLSPILSKSISSRSDSSMHTANTSILSSDGNSDTNSGIGEVIEKWK